MVINNYQDLLDEMRQLFEDFLKSLESRSSVVSCSNDIGEIGLPKEVDLNGYIQEQIDSKQLSYGSLGKGITIHISLGDNNG